MYFVRRHVRPIVVRVIGLISDTHGLVRPAVLTALRGVELILHAGDVGAGVLPELRTIAPVLAVRGNTDRVDDPELAPFLEREFDGIRVHVSHGHEIGSTRPAALLQAYDADVIVYGHTHQPLIQRVDNRWVVNPGAAGPKRFQLPASVALMTLREGGITVELVDLEAVPG